MTELHRNLSAGSMASMSSVSMPELPNLPGVRRDLSLINPKLYKEYKASMTQGLLAPDEIAPRIEEENSVESFLDSHRFSQILTPFPTSGASYNDITGRYSLISQQQDRLKKSRSLPYTNQNNLPSFIQNEGRVCSFIAYFTEVPRDGIEDRSRMVIIKLFLEDNSLEMVEPRVENSGTIQGKFLKRHVVCKPGTNLPYTLDDMYAGAQLDIYNRVYTVIDCDNSTKKTMSAMGRDFGEPMGLPGNMYDPKSRAGMSRAAPRTATREGKNKAFFKYDTKVLRFYGVWDCRSMLFGDEINVKVHYSLAENTMEVVPINGRNSGRDRLPKLLKKTAIMKPTTSNAPLSPSRATGFDFNNTGDFSLASNSASPPRSPTTRGNGTAATGSQSPSRNGTAMTLQSLSEKEKMQPTQQFHWTDLKVGLTIPVASMTLLLVDADDFTREFYKSKGMPLDAPISRPQPKYPTLETTIPPYNGFGSEQDSLQTCGSSLVLSAPTKDGAKMKLLANVVLRYEAIMADPAEVDKDRQFIIQIHMEDDTFQIREPPVRNSGHKGGIFLQRCKLETHDGSRPLQPSDVHLGATVEIHRHRFIVLNCDQYTFKFMEENSNQWVFSNLAAVLSKVRPKKEVLKKLFLTYPALGSRSMDVEELREVLEKAGLKLVKQEVHTLFRAVDVARSGSVKMTQFLKYVMEL